MRAKGLSDEMRVLYEQGHWCQGLSRCFSFIRIFAFVAGLGCDCMLLSTGFVFALWMS